MAMASIRLLGGGIGGRVTSTGSLGRAVAAGAASAGCKPPGFVRVGLAVPPFSMPGRVPIRRFSRTSDACTARLPAKIAIVMVGSSNRFTFKPGNVMGMDAGDVLEALAKHAIFSKTLEGVNLADCQVWVCTSDSKRAPTAEEEAKSVQLDGAMTPGKLTENMRGSNVFIHVRLPADTGAGKRNKLVVSETAEELLASLDACLSTEVRRSQLKDLARPHTLTTDAFLFGMSVAEAHESGETAKEFVEDGARVREDTIRAVADGFSARLLRRASAKGPAMCNPLVALQSAPGGGKSALLDTIGVLSARGLWDQQLCADKDMRDILNNSIAIPITYTSGSNPDLGSYDANVQTGLALRILHSFFVRPRTLDFGSFCELVPQGGVLTPARAVRCCLLAAQREMSNKRGVVLLVDEIVRLYDAKPDASLLSDLGALLDTFPSDKLNVVCTTVNASVLLKEEVKARRKIVWAALPALNQAASESLLLRALQRRIPSATVLPMAVRVAISDAAGHPRSLQYVKEAMLELIKGEAGLSALYAPTH